MLGVETCSLCGRPPSRAAGSVHLPLTNSGVMRSVAPRSLSDHSSEPLRLRVLHLDVATHELACHGASSVDPPLEHPRRCIWSFFDGHRLLLDVRLRLPQHSAAHSCSRCSLLLFSSLRCFECDFSSIVCCMGVVSASSLYCTCLSNMASGGWLPLLDLLQPIGCGSQWCLNTLELGASAQFPSELKCLSSGLSASS